MRAIADSGPLIHLAAVSQFELLRLYCSELLVPHAVFQEVVEVGRGQPGSRETEAAEQSGWIAITHLKETARIELFLREGMSPTDASVIALAQENPDFILLADDLAVRMAALSAGLQVFGTIGILIDGKCDGHLSNLKRTLDELIEAGFYLDPRGSLYREALRLGGEV